MSFIFVHIQKICLLPYKKINHKILIHHHLVRINRLIGLILLDHRASLILLGHKCWVGNNGLSSSFDFGGSSVGFGNIGLCSGFDFAGS